jgi:adenosylhomocysteine nucleosidase
MKIGIIFAMKEELNEFLNDLKIEKEYNIYNLKLIETTINKNKCILVESGIGKVNAARTTQILIDKIKVDYIFNIGVAGGIDKSLNIGDIIIGEKLVQHDFDFTAFNYERGYIPDIGTFIESNEYLIKIAEKSINEAKKGIIASGDIFCKDPKISNKINKVFNALCVEMEGAAIAQVCYLCNIPFLILRCISDVPNNNNEITFQEFLESSSKKIANGIKIIIKNL